MHGCFLLRQTYPSILCVPPLGQVLVFVRSDLIPPSGGVKALRPASTAVGLGADPFPAPGPTPQATGQAAEETAQEMGEGGPCGGLTFSLEVSAGEMRRDAGTRACFRCCVLSAAFFGHQRANQTTALGPVCLSVPVRWPVCHCASWHFA